MSLRLPHHHHHTRPAPPGTEQEAGEGEGEEESDYGSDIDLTDEDLVLRLLDTYPTPPLYPPLPPLPASSHDPTQVPTTTATVPKPVVKTRTRFDRNGALLLEFDELAPQEPDVHPTSPTSLDSLPSSSSLSPFTRFRSRRAQLSVTDLVAGIWCEQQFQYTLERGFRRRTPAMAKGTKMHKVLEEQVHTTIPVSTETREDAFGLKLFNMCQGLVSLEETGLTRELDVFGFLDSVLVQGVIDEVTYDDPDPGCNSSSSSSSSSRGQRAAFITDTKTRSTERIPGGSQLRSTAVQLMLYHRLLTMLPVVPFADVLAHHGLCGTTCFSDSFVAQIASVVSGISLDELLENNNLYGMWKLVLRRLETAVPAVGATVGVVFRAQSTGVVMARRAWGVDGVALESHLSATMEWWRGKRGSVGVDIEDAWKCRICDFEESCEWRLGQVEKLAQEVRAKKVARSEKKKMERTGEEDVEEGRRSSGSDSEGSVKLRKKKARTDKSKEPDSEGVSGADSENPKGKVRARRKLKKVEGPDSDKGEGVSENDGKTKVRARRKPKKAEEPVED